MVILNKKIILYFISAIIISFLLAFFYQTLVEEEFNGFKVKYRFFSGEKSDNFLLISGWKANKEANKKFVSMKKKRAIFVFDVPEEDSISLTFICRINNPNQLIEVYSQGTFIGELKIDKTKKWLKQSVVIPAEKVKKGLNKLELIKVNNSEADFYELIVSNYEDRKLTFLRAYVVWDTVRWYSKRGGIPVDWQFCLWGAVGFLGLWMMYSLLFWLITDEKYLFILRLDFWTYLPAVIIFSILFLIAKVISAYTFFYYKLDFWLVLLSSISIGKIYQIIKYSKEEKLKLRIQQIRDHIIGKYNICANALIVIFMILFFICAILLMMKMRTQAEHLANIAFLFLIVGIFLNFIKYFTQKGYLEDE